jgi:histidyl-tRNA synthetase
VGFALGSERVLLAAEKTNFFENIKTNDIVFVAVADEFLFDKAFAFANDLLINKNNICAKLNLPENITVEGPLYNKSLKAQFKLADKIGAKKVIILGNNELINNQVVVKDMQTQQQQLIKF